MNIHRLGYGLVAVAALALMPNTAFGQGSTLQRDTFTTSSSPATNNGSSTVVKVSGTGSGAVANGYFRFGMSNSLPKPGGTLIDSSKIAKATVKLYLSK